MVCLGHENLDELLLDDLDPCGKLGDIGAAIDFLYCVGELVAVWVSGKIVLQVDFMLLVEGDGYASDFALNYGEIVIDLQAKEGLLAVCDGGALFIWLVREQQNQSVFPDV